MRKVNGKLFQGRFKSLIVEEDAYLRALLHYVHLNPVRAHLRACRIGRLPVVELLVSAAFEVTSGIFRPNGSALARRKTGQHGFRTA